MEFTKYQGTGNDFVLFEIDAEAEEIDTKSASRLCERHFGVGADGIIEFRRSSNLSSLAENSGGDVHHASVRFINPDGSIAEMCGNGVRCAALHLALNEKDESAIKLGAGANFAIDTGAGIRQVTVSDLTKTSANVTVNMGQPRFESKSIPADFATKEVISQPIEVNGATVVINCVSMGNPHTVIFLDDPANIAVFGKVLTDEDFLKFGPLIEHHPMLPARTNVEFVNLADTSLKVRVWERGVGETLACGTGACATYAVAQKLGHVTGSTNVRLAGGDLLISYNGDDIFMSGEAKLVFSGKVDI